MLSLQNLSKKFGTITAVDELSLEIFKGEIFGLLGPNGAGKTTTIRMITGIYKSDIGQVLVDKIDIQKEPEKAKAQIGYIPDDPFVYEKLTGREFLHFVGELFLMPKQEIEAGIQKYLKIYPMADLLDIHYGSYSRGTKQKLSIMAAFLHKPKLLVIDEPILGLDPQSSQATKKLFLDFKKNGGTVFLSTHTLSFAEQIADRIGIIHRGKLLEFGTLQDLRQKAHLQQASLEELFLKLTE